MLLGKCKFTGIMKMTKLNAVFLCCIFSFTVMISCSYSDVKQNYYKDLYKISDNQKMWLPEILYADEKIKDTVLEVFENHDLDTNEIWGRFQSDFDFSKMFADEKYNSFPLNQKKIRKRLKQLGINDVQSSYFFSTKSFNCILYFNSEKNLYFYYGTYK